MQSLKLFYNGKIYLGNKKFGYGFEVDKNRFKKIFHSVDEIDFNKYKNKYNLNEQLVLPGLIDSHCHLLLTARNLDNLNFENVKSIKVLQKVINEKIKSKNLPFIYGEGYNENNFDSNIILNRFELDKINSTIPIFIFRRDLHKAIVNTIALKCLNIFKKKAICKYGLEIELDSKSFLPNGIIKENACQIIRDYVGIFYNSESDYKNLKKMCNKLIKYGISGVLTCDIFEGKKDYIYKIYEKLNNEYKTIRINHQLVFYNRDNLKSYLEFLKHKKLYELIKDIKLFNDGTLGSKTAFLSKHYNNEKNNFGIKNYDAKELTEFVKITQEYGKQIAIHSIGDASSLFCINALKKIDCHNSKRHKLIHFQIFDKNLLCEAVNMNLLFVVQPVFLEEDLNILNQYVDDSIATDSYCFNEIFKKNNKLVTFSSDAPVCSMNPWLNIYYAINGNQLHKPQNIKRSFNIYDAIDCYTINAAYSLFEENKRGKIAESYLADFIVLNHDIFSLKSNLDILKTKVVAHYINGKKLL